MIAAPLDATRKAYTQREKVKNKFTGQYDEADERLMRSIEEKIDILGKNIESYLDENMAIAEAG